MAVTTLASIPQGFLPTEVGSGPFPDTGYSSWWTIRESLLEIISVCVGNGAGGIRWYGKLFCLFPALSICSH